MTFQELQLKLGIAQNESDWRQHKNGGGWVRNDAQVHDKAFIGEDAAVLSYWSAQPTIVGKNATIEGGTIKGGTIEGGTIWGGTIKGGTIWGGTIKGGTIWGGTWNTTPLFIAGSRHTVTNGKPGHIVIGCKCKPFQWWTSKEAEDFARRNEYDDAAIAEYKLYIALVITLGK